MAATDRNSGIFSSVCWTSCWSEFDGRQRVVQEEEAGDGNADKTTREKLATSQRKIKFSQRRRPKTCENCKYRMDSQVEGG